MQVDVKKDVETNIEQDVRIDVKKRAITEMDQKKSINLWREIFGAEFPTYG